MTTDFGHANFLANLKPTWLPIAYAEIAADQAEAAADS